MEDGNGTSSSTTKEVTSPVYYYPGSFHEVIRAILKCLGLETEFQQNPISSCPKKEDDGKLLNHDQLDSPKETSDPPSSADAPRTLLLDPPADLPSTTRDGGGSCCGFPMISLFTPKRPGTDRGSGGQIN